MNTIEELIRNKHSGDEEQIEFIFSTEKKIVVTAPAGCGKTTTMISKIAWEISTGNIPANKRILAMTFSIPAATKIKNAVQELLPELIESHANVINRVDVSNYHNFATRLLYKHGYLLHEDFAEFESFKIMNESDSRLDNYITSPEKDVMIELERNIQNLKYKKVNALIPEYYKILHNKLFPNRIITFNGLLLAAIKILDYNNIKQFYQKYYKIIIIDEFQDTNFLAFKLVNKLIGNNSLFLLGDDIQKIYGFMGAIDDIFSQYERNFNMKRIVFKNNYRFCDKDDLRNLDLLFREYASNYSNNNLCANMNFKLFSNETKEAKFIKNGLEMITSNDLGRAAILVRSSYQATNITALLDENNFKYFNAIFTESDEIYVNFHNLAIDVLSKLSNDEDKITKSVLNKLYDNVLQRKNEINNDKSKTYIIDSLLKLLAIMIEKSNTEYNSPQERYAYVNFILANNSLKHMIEFIEDKVIVTTIHSAKGLEWDYVIIPKVISGQFPSYNGVCNKCKDCKNCVEGYNYCKNLLGSDCQKDFKDEVNVFYVGITRARKNVFVTSNTDLNRHGYTQKTSCLINLDGINKLDFDWKDVL